MSWVQREGGGVNYFTFIADRMFKVTPRSRPVNKDGFPSVEFEPVDVSAMQGIIVGLPSVEEASMLLALFGYREAP